MDVNEVMKNFTGGTITTSGGYQIHTFTGSGSLVGIPDVYSIN
jgi:hypothetical protein